jgi:hypothetical protein
LIATLSDAIAGLRVSKDEAFEKQCGLNQENGALTAKLETATHNVLLSFLKYQFPPKLYTLLK